MSGISIKITDVDLSNFKARISYKLRVGLRNGGRSAAQRTLQHIQGNLVPNASPHPPIDRGLYRAGFRVSGDLITTPIVIENPVPYACIVEYGVRAANVKPGRKMLQALAEWAQRKGVGNAAAKGRAGAPSKGEGKSKASAPAKGAKPAQGAEARKAGAREAAGSLVAPIMSTKGAKHIAKLIKSIRGLMKKLRLGGGARTKNKTTGKQSQPAATSVEAEAIAWAIAISMKKKGIFGGTGLRIMEKAREKLLKEFLPQEMSREVARSLRGGP